MGLLDVVKAVKPNILIGLSTCGGLFSGMTWLMIALIEIVLNYNLIAFAT